MDFGIFDVLDDSGVSEPGVSEPEQLWLGERSLYLSDQEAWLWLVADDRDEWCSLGLSFDCEGPPDKHCLAYELEALGSIGESLQLETHDEVLAFLFQEGIAPGQPFLAKVKFQYSGYQSYYGENDVDVDVEITVRQIERWAPERVLLAWESFWGRWHLMQGIW